MRSKEVDGKGVMVFVEYIGTQQEYTMAGFLPTETVGRSLVLHDAMNPLQGVCHDKDCRKETIIPQIILRAHGRDRASYPRQSASQGTGYIPSRE